MFYPRAMRFYIILILAILLAACSEENKIETDIEKLEVNFDVERFDKAILNAKTNDLLKLKEAFPFLFSKHIPDSIWVERLNDTLQRSLLEEVMDQYEDFKSTKLELQQLFQHLKYYEKTFEVPRVITLTNDVAYRDKTIVTDTIVLIALDNFLGQEHEYYQNIPRYITQNMEQPQIVVDVTEGYAEKFVYQANRNTLLDEMIYYGKLLYFKDVMIPFKSDAEKIGYSQAQLDWAEANESPIWSYFVEKELLYDTDNKLPPRFISEAPFSKFYLELDRESPGRLGQYIGWQIVRAYADKTDESVFEILQKDPEEIFRKSKFKPKK
ncbi:gliding motility lipoprotein GldB [Winogradskyella poriferorum]|uniref:gliding motility lipoprotein GldB n=1 Tax=Winogradskyella poriferorum TaxID=307627 RepID=UPI003D64F760